MHNDRFYRENSLHMGHLYHDYVQLPEGMRGLWKLGTATHLPRSPRNQLQNVSHSNIYPLVMTNMKKTIGKP